MDRDSASKAQLDLRKQLIDMLSQAGWKGGVENERFERGDWVQNEMVMRCRPLEMALTMRLALEPQVLVFGFQAHDGRGATITMRCLDKSKALVNLILNFQQELTETNYRQELRKLMEICDEVYAQDAEGNLQRLRDHRRSSEPQET
jgi:hypothetical protein